MTDCRPWSGPTLRRPPLNSPRTGGEILVANLLAQGATHVFCVPGESYLAVLDALHDVGDRLQLIVCRQEGGAAFMAEACGKLTGRPGIAMVTRGPGASNAAIGIHTAAQDSSPMIVFVGQVGSDFADREAFQEIDYRRMYGSIAKWVAQIDRAERIPEYVAHAWHITMAGRPGPVVLALPEDMLTSSVVTTRRGAGACDECRCGRRRRGDSPRDARARAPAARPRRRSAMGRRGMRRPEAVCGAKRLAGGMRIPQPGPVRQSGTRNYAGDVGIGVNPKLAARVRDADVLLVIGERLGEMVTGGYTLIAPPSPTQSLIHVHPGAEEIGSVFQPALGIVAAPGPFLAAINALAPPGVGGGAERVLAANAEYDAWRARRPVPGALDLWQVVAWLDTRLPDDAILTNGAGNYTAWLHRIYRYRRFRTQLAPYSGAMGYGVPAAIAAKALHPERIVVSWNGDGCFLMNGQELATAVRHDLAVVFVVIDNGMYGTIRMHQERSLSRPRVRNGARQSRFCGTRAGVWRAGRDGIPYR